MSHNSSKETKTEILSQFIIYSLFAGVTTIINLGGQILFTNIMGLNYVLGAIIALAFGYTTKFFLDCFITFKKQRKEEMDIRKHYLIYMMTAVIFYILNVIIQIYVCTPIIQPWFSDPPLIEILAPNNLKSILKTVGPAFAAVVVVFLLKFPFDKYIVFKLLPEKMTQ
ncbi:MAG: GtrA family protein [Candidatus Helarchaeota archaeon]